MAVPAPQHVQPEALSSPRVSRRRRSSPSTMTARDPAPRTFTHAHRQRLDRAAEHYLQLCYRQATRATVNEFAAFLNRHPNYLARIASAILGTSLLVYLRRRQLEEAERLILVTTLDMKEIALRAGFGTASTFYRHFRESYGMSPGAFRQVRK
jgi:AraC-like DNA-binding protein